MCGLQLQVSICWTTLVCTVWISFKQMLVPFSLKFGHGMAKKTRKSMSRFCLIWNRIISILKMSFQMWDWFIELYHNDHWSMIISMNIWKTKPNNQLKNVRDRVHIQRTLLVILISPHFGKQYQNSHWVDPTKKSYFHATTCT